MISLKLLSIVIVLTILTFGCVSESGRKQTGQLETDTNNAKPIVAQEENTWSAIEDAKVDAPEPQKQPSEELTKLKENLEEAKQKLDELSAVKECAKKCSGEEANIPAVYNELYAACYQAYYYGGAEALTEMINSC